MAVGLNAVEELGITAAVVVGRVARVDAFEVLA